MPPQAATTRLDRAVAAHRWREGAALEAAMLRVERARESTETLLALADALTQGRDYAAALALLQRLIAQGGQGHVDQARAARAHLRAGLIQWRGHQRATAAAQHLLAISDLVADARVKDAARQALQEIEAAQSGRPTS